MRFRDLTHFRLSCAERPPRFEERRPVRLPSRWKALQKIAHYGIQDEDDFVVFIDKDLDVYWATTDKHDASFEGEAKGQLYNVLTRATVVETLPSRGLDYEDILRFKRLIGQAIVCGFSKQYDNGLRCLDFARKYLDDRTSEVSRSWYLSSSIIFSIPFAAVALSFWLARDTLQPYFGADLFWLIMAGCCGALGALLSVMSRTGKLAFSSSSGRCLHQLEAVSRLSVGALSAGIVNLAIQSKYFIPSISDNSTGHAMMVLAAIAAGASERLAPSIISQFDKRAAAQSYESLDTEQEVSQQMIPNGRARVTRVRRRVKRARRAV